MDDAETSTGPDTNLVLGGFMGTGKTTVGQLVAQRLGRRFVDVDAVVEQHHGPIPDIFRLHGEEGFRDLESEVIESLAGRRAMVIALGGGALGRDRNVEHLRRHGRIVCLTAPVETVLARVAADGVERRPMLGFGDPATRVEALLAERRAVYARFDCIDTDGRTPDDVADELVAMLVG